MSSTIVSGDEKSILFKSFAEITKFYDIEDRLAEIYGTAASAAAALDHDEADYHHAYAHPRERGLERDHRNR